MGDAFILGGAGHSSLISDDDHIFKKHSCEKCQKTFGEARHLQQHQQGHCHEGEPNLVYPGGTYQRKWTIFEQLQMWCIVVDPERQLCEAFATWDCEALLVQVQKKYERATMDEIIEQRLNDQNLEVEYGKNVRRLQIREEHVLATCALKSSVPGAEQTQFFANNDPAVVIQQVYEAMVRISDLNYNQQLEKFDEEFKALEAKRQRSMRIIEDEQARGIDTRRVRAGLHKLDRLVRKLDQYCRQLTILTFNGSRYDLNLVKRYLIPEMIRDTRNAKTLDPKGYHPWPKGITRGTTIMALMTEKFRFLDVINYLSPGTSLDKFIKAYDPTGDQKGIFPYELLRKFEDLETTTVFPPQKSFYSTLKNKGISDEEYEDARRVWDSLETKNLLGFIKEYNSKDVEPFLEAVKKVVKLYWSDNEVDIFKEAISIPGVCMTFLFRFLEREHPSINFGLFSDVEATICQEFYGKTSLCGGLSFIGQRIAEKGVTEIKRATEDDLCVEEQLILQGEELMDL